MKCSFVIKVCSKCKRILVANEMNFSKKKGGKWNLRAECKICEFTYKKQYYKNNKDKIYEWQEYAYKKWGDNK